ncbi:DUF3261 domain-containing protein [Pseudomonas sp. NPDC090202]|uniref:DUF3261 domain-containing protein n=1 Tax=unclassified Pseudomonas TaxID=196821 RepID=UPI003828EDA2
MNRVFALVCALLLSACASQVPLPAQLPHIKFPQQLHVQREQAGQHLDWQLEIQKERHGVLCSLMDSAGNTLSRQELHEDTWKADDQSQDPEARELFAAVLFALTPEKDVRFNYPGAVLRPHGRSLDERWSVDYASEGFFRITLEDGLRYIVSPVRGKANQ